MMSASFGDSRRWLAFLLLASCWPLLGADRCADARDDIRRAMALADRGEEAKARTLLRGALLACPVNPQNLELLAEAYDALGELALAGTYRTQALRLRRITAKPVVNLTSLRPSIERGQTSTLNWSAAYVTEVEISPDFGRVAAKGSKVVAPTVTTDYQLTARGPGGVTTATVQIAVTLPRLRETDILGLLQNDVPQPRIAQLVAERGIAFELSPAVEERLRSAGATQTLIEALRSARK